MHRLFLPMSRFEMDKWGWSDLDVILITGDAFIDHPCYDVAVIARVLENRGYRVGIIAQPNPLRDMEFAHLGNPKLFFYITSGYNDSMVANYSPNKKKRKFDFYAPGRVPGKRPDHALVAYSQTIRRLFPDSNILLGGIEASLRRLSHYDFWDNEIKKSVLSEAEADLLIHGTGERQVVEIAKRLSDSEPITSINDIRGTAWKLPMDRGSDLRELLHDDYIHMPSFEQIYIDRDAYLEAFKIHSNENDPYTGKPLVQEHPAHYVVLNPPQMPLTQEEMDEIHALDYIRTPHPRYKRAGAIAAFETIKFRLNTHRGCFAGCSFCPYPIYHGRYIQSRSEESVLAEAEKISGFHYFRRIISNVGGPTGNMFKMNCRRLDAESVDRCDRPSCTYPEICEHLQFDHGPYIDLCNKIMAMDNIDKLFIDTGLRYDILLVDPRGNELLDMVITKFIQGNFKVAPEHISEAVSCRIRKYSPETTLQFLHAFKEAAGRNGLGEIRLLPHLIAAHPGSGMDEAIEVAQFMKEWGLEQIHIQDFTPVPMTPSTCMFYSGIDPFTDEKVYRPLAYRERKLQRAILHFYKPQNERYVFEALQEANRTDLIGDGPDCLLAEEPKIYKF